MNRNEVKEMCRRMNVLFDQDHPDHISEETLLSNPPPFMQYTLTETPVIADGVMYIDIKRLVITLFSDTEESSAEGSIERVLREEELRWRKSREFIEEYLMWNIIYTLEV